MILHAENRFLVVMHAFNCLIIEVYPVNFDVFREGVRIHSEAMILGGDFDLTGFQVFHGLIAAAMAEFEFEGFTTERLSQNLVTKTDTENGDACLNQVFDSLNGVAKGGGIPRAIRQENAVRFILDGLAGGSGRGQNLDTKTMLPQAAEDVVFHPEVVGHYRNGCRRKRR